MPFFPPAEGSMEGKFQVRPIDLANTHAIQSLLRIPPWPSSKDNDNETERIEENMPACTTTGSVWA
jgi:hypothetical protein